MSASSHSAPMCHGTHYRSCTTLAHWLTAPRSYCSAAAGSCRPIGGRFSVKGYSWSWSLARTWVVAGHEYTWRAPMWRLPASSRLCSRAPEVTGAEELCRGAPRRAIDASDVIGRPTPAARMCRATSDLLHLTRRSLRPLYITTRVPTSVPRRPYVLSNVL